MLGRVCPNLPYPPGSLPVRGRKSTRIVMALPELTGRPTVAGAAPAAPVLLRRSTKRPGATPSRTRPGIVMARAAALPEPRPRPLPVAGPVPAAAELPGRAGLSAPGLF